MGAESPRWEPAPNWCQPASSHTSYWQRSWGGLSFSGRHHAARAASGTNVHPPYTRDLRYSLITLLDLALLDPAGAAALVFRAGRLRARPARRTAGLVGLWVALALELAL